MSHLRNFTQAKLLQFLFGGSAFPFSDLSEATDTELQALDRLLETNATELENRANMARELQQRVQRIVHERTAQTRCENLVPFILRGNVAFFATDEHEAFFLRANHTGHNFLCCKTDVSFRFHGECYVDDDYHVVDDTLRVDLDSMEVCSDKKSLKVPSETAERYPDLSQTILDYANSSEFQETIREDVVIQTFDHENDGCGINGLIWRGTLPIYYAVCAKNTSQT